MAHLDHHLPSTMTPVRDLILLRLLYKATLVRTATPLRLIHLQQSKHHGFVLRAAYTTIVLREMMFQKRNVGRILVQ
jgi:hypothetical protein